MVFCRQVENAADLLLAKVVGGMFKKLEAESKERVNERLKERFTSESRKKTEATVRKWVEDSEDEEEED